MMRSTIIPMVAQLRPELLDLLNTNAEQLNAIRLEIQRLEAVIFEYQREVDGLNQTAEILRVSRMGLMDQCRA